MVLVGVHCSDDVGLNVSLLMSDCDLLPPKAELDRERDKEPRVGVSLGVRVFVFVLSSECVAPERETVIN